MTDELNLTPEQYVITLTVCLIALALLLWYTGRQPWLELQLTDEVEESTTDTVKARYGAYIQSRGKYYN